jgi:pimeloyl-ACP methyl ester carboxylesterase
MTEVVERELEVAGLRTHYRDARSDGAADVLYVHGVPTASWDWLSHLERIGGVAPDLPGFGESEKPEDFDYSIEGFDRWLEAFVDAAGMERFSLVVHDWGSVGLALAQRFPERVERLVMHASVPFLPGYRWHWVARIWRRPVMGELFMASSSKWGFKQISRQANAAPGPMPAWFLDRVWRGFDSGTRRAILHLYRSSAPEALARAGTRLGELRCPALILWPTQDPYLGVEFARGYADALGGEVELELIESAGHWSWVDRPDVVDMVAGFLRSGG